jgi:hypothetical protein
MTPLRLRMIEDHLGANSPPVSTFIGPFIDRHYGWPAVYELVYEFYAFSESCRLARNYNVWCGLMTLSRNLLSTLFHTLKLGSFNKVCTFWTSDIVADSSSLHFPGYDRYIVSISSDHRV